MVSLSLEDAPSVPWNEVLFLISVPVEIPLFLPQKKGILASPSAKQLVLYFLSPLFLFDLQLHCFLMIFPFFHLVVYSAIPFLGLLLPPSLSSPS